MLRREGARARVTQPVPRVRRRFRSSRLLEGEAAADHERDEVFAPEAAGVGDLTGKLPALVDAISRQVGAKVRARRTGGLRLADIEDLDERAGLRIPLAEEEEVEGGLARQDHEVRLHVP